MSAKGRRWIDRASFKYGVACSVALCFLLTSISVVHPKSVYAAAVTKTRTITFGQDTDRTRSKQIVIPNLATIESVDVNNGDASYNKKSDGVEIKVSNGVGHKVQTGGSYTPAKSKYVTNQTSKDYNKDGYSGTLTKYVSSGSYTPEDTKYVSNQTSKNYSKSGYKGTLSKYVASGSYTPARHKSVSVYKESGSNSFPSSVNYNSSGYTGKLGKDGGATVISGHSADSKYIKNYGDTYQGRKEQYCWKPAGGWYYNKPINVSPMIKQYMSYSKNGYQGRLKASYVDRGKIKNIPLPKNPRNGQCAIHHSYVNHYQYFGTVRRSDTRVWRQKFSGKVTKPATDTRVYRYQGNVTKPADDTRVYRYKGEVTKPAVDTRTYETDYAYKVTIKFTQNEQELDHVPSGVTFNDVTLNGKSQTTEKLIQGPLLITDTGDSPWHVTVRATPVKDSDGHTLPKGSLELITANQKRVLGLNGGLHAHKSLTSRTLSIDDTTRTIISENKAVGAWKYEYTGFKLKLSLNPKDTYVNPDQGQSNYKTVLTWTVVSGP